MRKKNSSKGLVSVAFIFILIICLILTATIGILWSKAKLSASRLKRFHAINYVEAALNEAVKRFHTGYTDTAGKLWNIENWVPPGQLVESGTVEIENVLVNIKVIKERTPPVTGPERYKISATVDYRGINL